jgi:hypothetical protein
MMKPLHPVPQEDPSEKGEDTERQMDEEKGLSRVARENACCNTVRKCRITVFKPCLQSLGSHVLVSYQA